MKTPILYNARACARAGILFLTLTACHSDWRDGIPDNPTTDDTMAIEFGTTAADAHQQTRADGTLVNFGETWLPATALDADGKPATKKNDDGETVEVGPFVGVFGYYTGTKKWAEYTDTEPTADIFYNTKMIIGKKTQATGTAGTGNYNELTYDDKRFWPNDGGMMSFWAYYPWNATDDPGDYGVALTKRNAADEGTWGIGAGEGMGAIRFTMHPDASKQNDFLISDLRADLTKSDFSQKQGNGNLREDGIPNRVTLRFRHMLAQVRLYAFIRGLDQVVYQTLSPTDATTVTVTEAMLTSYADYLSSPSTLSPPSEFTAAGVTMKPFVEVSEGVWKWYEVGETVTKKDNTTVTLTAENLSTNTTEKPAVMDEYGTWLVLSVGDKLPDESKSKRWDREGGTWDVTHSRRRANITYKMSINNIKTTAVFTPQYTDGATTFTYKNGSALGSATVDHYIPNPYWFHFDESGQRDRLNTTYMYGYFEDTAAYGSGTDAYDTNDGSGQTWNTYGSGQSNAMGYELTSENSENSENSRHYNYAPCNIVMAVPQVMDDNNVPNITITATGKYLSGKDGEGKSLEGTEAVSHVTINMIGQGLKWESGFIYSYAFLEDNLQPGVDIVRGPESLTIYFDPNSSTDQW